MKSPVYSYRLVFPVFMLFSPFLVKGQQASVTSPSETLQQSCVYENPECATPANPQLIYHTPVDWPDSLVNNEQYFVWVEGLSGHAGTHQVPVDRYQYYVKWPTDSSGVIELGPSGRIAFYETKEGGWLNCEFLEMGTIKNFTLIIAHSDGRQVTIDVNNGEIKWLGRSPKKAAH